METAFDWITVIIFSGLIVLFLQRSTSDVPPERHDSILLYLGAGVACAVVNYIGNHGPSWLAIALLIGTLAYIQLILKPFAGQHRQ